VNINAYFYDIKSKLRSVIRIISTTKNFYCPLLVYFNLIKKCNAVLFDRSRVEVSKETWGDYWNRITLLYLKKKLRFRIEDYFVIFNFKGKELRFKIPEIPSEIESSAIKILENFYSEPYRFLNVKNKIVIDVGAYIGDTSVYFALKGAQKVIAIEPHPYIFELLKVNVDINNLEKIIIPINAGLSDRRGKVPVRASVIDTWGLRLDDCIAYTSDKSDNVRLVPLITLHDVLIKIHEHDELVLKIDCEGCEYNILLKHDHELKKFDEIILEYHGEPNTLIRALAKAGFKAKAVIQYKEKLGLIHAKRVTKGC